MLGVASCGQAVELAGVIDADEVPVVMSVEFNPDVMPLAAPKDLEAVSAVEVPALERNSVCGGVQVKVMRLAHVVVGLRCQYWRLCWPL